MIVHADALEHMRTMEPAAVGLVIADPPYFKVVDHDWDHAWSSEADYLEWLDRLCVEWRRLLKPNGSLYCFCSPLMAWKVEGIIRKRFRVLNSIAWVKGWHETPRKMRPQRLRRFFPQTERIVFAEQRGGDSWAKGETRYHAACDQLRGFLFEPLRAYLDGERKRAGINFEQVRQAVGCAPKSGLPSHWFTRSQWMLPTAEHYAKLQELFNRRGGRHLRREYEHLRREYEDLRRPFDLTSSRNAVDAWEFRVAKQRRNRHGCEKPLALAEHIVAASSRPGDLVLDPFCGSGVFGEACARLGRDYLGIDADPQWTEAARHRVGNHEPLFPEVRS